MNKILIALFIGLLASCSSDGGPEGAAEEIEDDCCSGAEEAVEEWEEVEDAPEIEPNIDSISDLYHELEAQYKAMAAELGQNRNNFYCMTRTTFDVYSSGEANWYFDKNFELVYYQSDFGAEGGYGESEFWKVKEEQFKLLFYQESDVDNPKNTIQTYGDNGMLNFIAGMNKDYYSEDEKETFLIPDIIVREFMFDQYLDKVKASSFVEGERYSFEDSKMVDSEYEGQTLAGYRLAVDRALYFHYYNLSVPETNEGPE